MKMDRYAASVLTFLYLQSLCFVRGATLPMKKNLVNPAGLIVENRNPRLQGEGSTNDDNFPRPTLATSVAGLKNRSDHVYGIYARISAWGHEHIDSHAYSETVIQVSNDEGGQFSAIRAGLHTYPSLYNDTKLHMFAHWTVDRDWISGCYNMDCPGFVPFKNNFPDYIVLPGMVVNEVSSYGKNDSSMILQIVKDERPGIGGDWWLYRVSGPLRFPLGYWPASLFAGFATEVAWYGAVGFNARGTEPGMGSGHGPGEGGPAKAAYFAEISLMGRDAYPVDPSSLHGLLQMVNYERCYQVAIRGTNTFFYGGPVRTSC